MTHQEKIEAIRKKCIEANPEIVELKFGCEVIVDRYYPDGAEQVKFIVLQEVAANVREVVETEMWVLIRDWDRESCGCTREDQVKGDCPGWSKEDSRARGIVLEQIMWKLQHKNHQPQGEE